ncbi:MAG: leucine-rich repeat domain-containing protein [Bacteroidales bacterium]|nr:leucine-rich repeat domain-containing protein [Bacteroidales bacterium]
MKRLVLFICTILCANVLSAQSDIGLGFYYEDIMYEITSENEVKVCHPRSYYYGGDCPSSIEIPSVAIYHMVIPGQGTFHDEYNVTSIGEDAFRGCSTLTSITIPNSVTSIGYCAFWGCNNLTSIDIPNSVTVIGESAFLECSSLTSVTIGNGVTSIGEFAFSECSSLTSVDIPNSVINIEKGAFGSCSSLTSITIPESVTSIARGAFYGCSFLQNVTCLATTPPTLEDNTVFPYPNIATLNVPCGSLEAYSAPTSFWNMFFPDRIEEDCSGLEDAEFAELSFYPNPTSGKVTFSQAIEKIEVIDLSGKTLQTYENANEINIEALPAGVYHLRMTIEDKTIMRKVIKE